MVGKVHIEEKHENERNEDEEEHEVINEEEHEDDREDDRQDERLDDREHEVVNEEDHEVVNEEEHKDINVYENGEEDMDPVDDNIQENIFVELNARAQHGHILVDKFKSAILYSDIEIDNYLDYLREIALKYFTREEIIQIPALFQKFKKSNKILIGKQLLALADNVSTKFQKSIIMYIFYYYIPKILKLIPMASSGLRLLKVILEKKEEFQKNDNLDYSEMLVFENRDLPKIERILGTILY